MERGGSRGQRGGQEEWEARDEWNQPAVVWAVPCDGRTPLSLCLCNSLSLLLSQSLKSFSPGFSEQKEAPTGGSPFSVTHEMMRTTQPLPHPLSPLPFSLNTLLPHMQKTILYPTPRPKTHKLHIHTLPSCIQWCGLDHKGACRSVSSWNSQLLTLFFLNFNSSSCFPNMNGLSFILLHLQLTLMGSSMEVLSCTYLVTF